MGGMNGVAEKGGVQEDMTEVSQRNIVTRGRIEANQGSLGGREKIRAKSRKREADQRGKKVLPEEEALNDIKQLFSNVLFLDQNIPCLWCPNDFVNKNLISYYIRIIFFNKVLFF